MMIGTDITRGHGIIVGYVLLGLLQITPSAGAGWNPWGPWSQCSRSCDGGAAYQQRTCTTSPGVCPGDNIRYRTCNNKACPDQGSQDFRELQCKAYNDVPYRGNLYQWVPSYHDVNNSCALRCTAEGFGFGVTLAPKVLDGTRCHENSRDMCINGACTAVGCDNIINSGKSLDTCGICGGDGTSCMSRRHPASQNGGKMTSSAAMFVWQMTESFGPCSAACGVGEQSTGGLCKDVVTGVVVYNSYCDQASKPPLKTRTCEGTACKHAWISGEWHPCSRSCGRGLSRRTVYCVSEEAGGGFRRVGATLCKDTQPHTERTCNMFPCPVWIAGDWAPCSVTCGKGSQHREAICRPTANHSCSFSERPITSRPCDTGVTCQQNKDIEDSKHTPDVASSVEHSRPSILFIDVTTAVSYHARTPATGNILSFREAPEVSFKVPDQRDENGAVIYDVMLEYKLGDLESSGFIPTEDNNAYEETGAFEGSQDVNLFSGAPSFVATQWSSCSATCGAGIRNRKVVCKVYHAPTQTVNEFPDSECNGSKPPETEVCKLQSCDHVSSLVEREVYIWRFQGYGECSASCLGGVQTAKFVCVRVRDFSEVPVIRCQDIHRPDSKPQACNIGPCPAEWKIVQRGPCSSGCGGGFYIQRITCVQRTGSGLYDINAVDPAKCPAKLQPPRKVACNLDPCLPTWRPQRWSACSASCGNASQTREVLCIQRLSPQKQNVMPNDFCPDLKPIEMQRCHNLPRCPKGSREYIVGDKSWIVQLVPMKNFYIDVGGGVTVLPRTTVKIKCPVRKISRKQIVWKFKGNVIGYKGRVRRNKNKGVLRIRKSRPEDAGVYTCIAGNASETIRLDFHSLQEADRKREDRVLLIMRNLDINETKVSAKGGKASLVTVEKKVKHVSALPFHYVTSAWSSCSKSCGGAGLQSRTVTCDLVFPYHYFIVDDSLCNNKGQEKPVNTKDCGFEKCPKWKQTEWSECSDQHCLRHDVGAKKRTLMCLAHNSSLVPLTSCDLQMKPNDTMECPNERCKAIWQTSSWSKCSKTCGGTGVKTRALACVWSTTGKPAGSSCRVLNRRPNLEKQCHSKVECDSGRCRDRSKYCSLVTRLNFCRYKQYHEDCCQSCTHHEHVMKQQSQRRRRKKY